MPRVLHVAQPVEAGLGTYVADVARDQLERGWEVVVACPPFGSLPQRLAADGVPHLPWPAGRNPGPTVLPELHQLARVVAQARPDVVHLQSSKAGLVGRLLLRGRLPVLFSPHAWSWLAATGPVATASLGWERVAVRWADHVVCVSHGEAELARRAGLAGRFVVVRSGVDVGRFATLPGDRERARAALGLPAGVPVAVSVGRLARQKGHDRLVEAWAQVRRQVPEARLVVLGEGEDRKALEARAVPGVLLAGEADVARHLAAADLFVLASRWEGLSLAVLEALAAGRSVVTTAVSGSEVVAPGTGQVLAVAAGDDGAVVRALVPAIVARLTDPRLLADEGQRAASYARAELNLSHTHDQLAELTQALVQHRRQVPVSPSSVPGRHHKLAR